MTAAVALVAGQAIRDYRAQAGPRRRRAPAGTALLLSGGGSLGFFHLGVIKALRADGLLPHILSGASAGSVMAAIVGTRNDRELAGIDEDDLAFAGFAEHRGSETPGSDEIRADLARAIPDMTFAEALEHSGRALNVAIAGRPGGGVLCGPRTTPDVLVRDAVQASCAVPLVFEPVVVRERRNGVVRPFRNGAEWVDGSLFADVPSAQIKRRYGVHRTIVSMVNPLVRPFLADDGDAGPGWRDAMLGGAKRIALGWARMARFSSFAAPKAHGALDAACRMIEQRYRGDLMLTPSVRFAGRDALERPSRERVRRLADDGERRTRDRLGELRLLAT